MKRSVLIVEDDALVRDVLRSAFEREYNVLEASGCSEAEGLLRNPIDIALIDYMLPDGDGFDILKAVRKVKPDLPIIVMTAYSTEGVVIRALRAGATEYVKKPLILAHLRKKVSDLLGGKSGEGLDEYPMENSRADFLLSGVAAFIEENYASNLTRDELAKQICMNKYKFSKLFNEKFGQSLKSYINSVRAREASKLLKNNLALSITDIANAVGYKNLIYFARVFREIYGMSPREHRMIPPEKLSSQGNLWSIE